MCHGGGHDLGVCNLKRASGRIMFVFCDCFISRIVKAQITDAGIYTCVASNRAGVDNKHHSLHVYGKPLFAL